MSLPQMSSIKMPGANFQTPIVFINSNAHGQIKQASDTTIETVDRQSIRDMTIIEINIASPTVVNILDDDTVHYLSQLLNKKLKFMKGLSQNIEFNENLMVTLRQIDKDYTSIIENRIVDQVIGQLDSLIEELSDIIIPNVDKTTLANKDKLIEFVDEDDSSIIEQIRDRIHFMDSFIRGSMFDYNFYTPQHLEVPMIKTHFSGDSLTSEVMNWRITAEELFEVPTVTNPHFIPGRRIPEVISSAANAETNYIVENKIDLLRFLYNQPITRNQESSRLRITNERLLQNLYEIGYRNVIIFNNSCATAVDANGYEITNPRTLRSLINDAKDIRQQSRIDLPKLNLRQRPLKIGNYEKIKVKLSNILRNNGYTFADAEINPNIRIKGGLRRKKRETKGRKISIRKTKIRKTNKTSIRKTRKTRKTK